MTRKAHTQKSKPHRLNTERPHKSVLIGMVAAWALVAILTGIFLINRGTKSQLGSDASQAKATLKVTRLRYDSAGAQPYPAPSGLKFAIVNVELSNLSPEVFDFAPVIQAVVTDELGRSWPMSPANVEAPIQAGPVAPGATLTGEISFLVPVDATKLTFIFDPIKPNGFPAKYILGQQ